jgi:hypothetical protein
MFINAPDPERTETTKQGLFHLSTSRFLLSFFLRGVGTLSLINSSAFAHPRNTSTPNTTCHGIELGGHHCYCWCCCQLTNHHAALLESFETVQRPVTHSPKYVFTTYVYLSHLLDFILNRSIRPLARRIRIAATSNPTSPSRFDSAIVPSLKHDRYE